MHWSYLLPTITLLILIYLTHWSYFLGAHQTLWARPFKMIEIGPKTFSFLILSRECMGSCQRMRKNLLMWFFFWSKTDVVLVTTEWDFFFASNKVRWSFLCWTIFDSCHGKCAYIHHLEQFFEYDYAFYRRSLIRYLCFISLSTPNYALLAQFVHIHGLIVVIKKSYWVYGY